MGLPDSYTIKTGAIQAYFDAFLGAEAPERFSIKFLQDLEFTASNDRLIIGVLKELGFLDADGVPQERYYEYLDRDRSGQVLAEGIKEAYGDLFAVNKNAHKLTIEDTFNKLRTLYKGVKKDTVIRNIAKTFVALCEIANFSKQKTETKGTEKTGKEEKGREAKERRRVVTLDSLQYHVNIVLPETRDQAVYDAIFKSLRDHLG